MARGKIQMKKIENPIHRQVTFCKRRAGLFKKAKELSVLCDAEIGVFIFSAHGKRYELASKGTMQDLIEKYTKTSRIGDPAGHAKENEPLDPKEEINRLNQEIQVLQKGLRCMSGVGEAEAGKMTLHELDAFEKHLETWIYHIRSAKIDIMLQEIQRLKNKEGILTAANKYLQEKQIEKQYSATEMTPLMTANIQYPLTIHNEIYQF